MLTLLLKNSSDFSYAFLVLIVVLHSFYLDINSNFFEGFFFCSVYHFLLPRPSIKNSVSAFVLPKKNVPYEKMLLWVLEM